MKLSNAFYTVAFMLIYLPINAQINMTYYLYDLDNGTKQALTLGSNTVNTIDTNSFGSNISIEAFSESSIGSVYMITSGAIVASRTENIIPYFFFEGDDGTPHPWARPTGEILVNARVYSVSNGETEGATPIREDVFRINFTAEQGSVDNENPTINYFTATPIDTNSIGLSWNSSDNVEVDSHSISYNGGSTGNFSGAETSTTISGLLANTSYTFTLTASDAVGNSTTASTQVTTDEEDTSNPPPTGGGGVDSTWAADGSNISYQTGNVGIGTNAVINYKLAIEGKIRTREVRVDQDTWPDYVFQEDYKLPTLEEIQKHIIEKGHLPNIPSAKEVKENGVELGEMNKLLLEKIEELTLHTIYQEKKIKTQEKRLNKIEALLSKEKK